MLRFSGIVLSLLAFTSAFAGGTSAQTINFEAPTYTVGNINGQDGWSKTGPFDSTVSSTAVAGFGLQSLRISNAVTSPSFGDHTFSRPIVNEAGETGAQNDGLSGGTRRNRFTAEFSIASAVPGAQQPGLNFSLSPDRGDGARMSFLRFEDQADGIHVIFFDYADSAPFGTTVAIADPLGCGAEDDFIGTDIATINRTNAHTIKLVLDLVDGSRNDVVRVYVDGTLRKTGTSWEDYFRFCEGTPTRTVDSVLFRTAGAAAPANLGNGFFIDGLTMTSTSNVGPATVKVTADDLTATPNLQDWFFYQDRSGDEGINNTLGTFVTGPGSPPDGSGSAQISTSLTSRPNLATYQFAGTVLANITEMKYTTYNPSAGNGGGSANRSAYLQFNVDFTGVDNFQRRLTFVPANNGGVTADNWKEWDAINNGNANWTYSGTSWPVDGVPGGTSKTWSQIIAQYPGVRIRVSDPFLGMRVGEPYADGYTENIDSFKFGTVAGTTIFDFEPAPLVVDFDGVASATDCNAAGSPHLTIQSAINAATAGATIKVCPGNYTEDVNVNKANVILQGSGVDVSTITGPHASGGANTLLITASGVTVDGFTITRTGNTAGTWAGNIKNQGVNVAASTGFTLQNSKVTGNRNGIYVGQSSNNTTIRRNIIDFNRTGIHSVDNNNILIEENFITNNWTMGILFRTEIGGLPSTVQTIRNNKISGNWYSEIENRDTPGTAVFNASGNHLGTTTATRVTTTSMEPGYTSQIPVLYGGTAVPPATHPTIAGPQSARVDYSPFLNSGTDTQPGTLGFQGDFANLSVNADSPQANGVAGNIQEGINMALVGGSVTAAAGTYSGNVDINKAVTLQGSPTFTGSLTTSAAGAVIGPGLSPGIINSGNLLLAPASTVNIELNGTTPGTGHDQLNVTGTVNLGGATLNLTSAFTPAPGNMLIIVNNDAADAVTGIFNGLPEGSNIAIGITMYQLSYIGGSGGNDVVLTVTSAPCNAVSIPSSIPTLTGNIVNVPINIDSVTGRNILGYSTAINYDPTKLTFLGIDQVGTKSSGMTVTVNSGIAGTLQIFAFGTVPPTGAGALLILRFNASGPIDPVATPVTFASFSLNEGVPCSTTQNGSVLIISSTITGTVTHVNAPLTTPVPLTTISAAGSIPVSTSTAASGTYSLSGLGSGPYTVTPTKTAQPIGTSNGISPTDSALIAQHGAGIVVLNANQITAGDVTGNGTLSPLDAAYIAQWSVGIVNPGITGTWKFIPVSRSYTSVNTPQTNQDYSAILLGDVTGNWSPTLLGGNFAPVDESLSASSKDAIEVSVPEIVAAPGSTVTIPVGIGDLTEKGVVAYQFDITYDPAVLEPMETAAEIAGTISEGMNVVSNSPEPGLLKVSVYGIAPVNGRGVLVNLRFSALGTVGSSTPLDIRGFVLNEGGITVRLRDGSVTVSEAAQQGTIRGKLLTAGGAGIPRTRVTIFSTTGERRTVMSGSFGNFEFGDLRMGESYVLNANHRRYSFVPQNVVIAGASTDIDLIANP